MRKPNLQHLIAESHRRQLAGEDYQAVANDMLTLLLADRSDWNESKAQNTFGVIAEDGEVVRHWVMGGSKLDTGCLVVTHEDCPLFWQLGNYRVSTRSGPMLYLVPVNLPTDVAPAKA